MIEFSLILISYNKPEMLKQTLKSLIDNIKSTNYEIIVVDNASTENNIKMIEQNFPNVVLIKNNTNLGFGKANNIGMENAKSEYLFFVNSDVILIDDPTEKMLQFYKDTSNIGLLGAQLLNSDMTKQESFYSFPSVTKRIVELTGMKKFFKKFYRDLKTGTSNFFEIDSIVGAFFLVSKDVFEKIGKFDTFYFMYVEDVDISVQSRIHGYRNFLYAESKIIHLGKNHEFVENIFLFENRNKGLIHYYKKNRNKFISTIFIIINLKLFLINFLITKIKHENLKSENYKKILKLYWRELFTQ